MILLSCHKGLDCQMVGGEEGGEEEGLIVWSMLFASRTESLIRNIYFWKDSGVFFVKVCGDLESVVVITAMSA